jgi:copper resistance protein B
VRPCLAAALPALISFAAASPASAQALFGEIDLLEYHIDGDDNLLFDGALAYGNEQRAVVAKLVVGGSVGQLANQIEGQLLYSHAIGGGFNLEAGVRHDFRPQPHLTYAVIGLAGDASENLALESYAFLSHKGDVTAEVKAIYDIALTPRTTVQPRLTLNFALQDVPEQGLASGVTDTELSLRLIHEITENFAPYVGIVHERLLDGSADIAREAGNVVQSTHFIIGISASF